MNRYLPLGCLGVCHRSLTGIGRSARDLLVVYQQHDNTFLIRSIFKLPCVVAIVMRNAEWVSHITRNTGQLSAVTKVLYSKPTILTSK
jgi:hypothetical protein